MKNNSNPNPLLLCTLLLMALGQAASAATLTVVPAETTVRAGETVDVAVTIAGLGDGTAPSLSAYDLLLAYDGTLLGYGGGVFGDPILGNQLDLFDLGSLQQMFDSPAGARAIELSFDDTADLEALQADSFTLFTFSFTALGSRGTSALTLQVNDLADGPGDLLVAEVVNGAVTVVPLPGALLLLLSAVGGLAGRAGLQRRQVLGR